MTFYQLKEHFGSVAKAAKALGLRRQAVYRWQESGVPQGQQYRIQVLTGGFLRAEGEKRDA